MRRAIDRPLDWTVGRRAHYTARMGGHRALALAILVMLATPAAGKERVVRLKLGPFRVEAERDREVCQAVRISNVPGMEVVSYEVRSLTTRHGKVDTHHFVLYGYRGGDSAAFPRP